MGHPLGLELGSAEPGASLNLDLRFGPAVCQQEHSKLGLTSWRGEPLLRGVDSPGSQWGGEGICPSQSSLGNGDNSHAEGKAFPHRRSHQQPEKEVPANRKINGPPPRISWENTDFEDGGLGT